MAISYILLLTSEATERMEQRPQAASNSSATQEIPAFYGITKFITVFTTARQFFLYKDR
jgi:hypothetical protein